MYLCENIHPMGRSLKELFQKFAMFVLTSSVGTVVDLGLHWVGVAFVFKNNYWGSFWIAPTVSFEVAAIVNFVISYFFIWNERITQHNTRSFFRHLAAYNATCVGGYILKFIAMQGIHFLFLWFGWLQGFTLEPVLCNLLGTCFSGGFNFFMSEFVIFNKTKNNKNHTQS